MGRKRHAFGTGPIGSIGPIGPIGPTTGSIGPTTGPSALYTDTGDDDRRSATTMLKCPSYADCNEMIGSDVFAYNGFWGGLFNTSSVVKVFDSEEEKRNSMRAYRVLERLHKEKQALKPLWVEEPKSGRAWEPPGLRIERYKPWRQLKDHDFTDEVSAWTLVDQVSKMHKAGIAHGKLSEDTIGIAGSGKSTRFVVSGSGSQVVSPLSEFYDGKLSATQERARKIIRDIVMAKCNGGLRCRIYIAGPIDGINETVDETIGDSDERHKKRLIENEKSWAVNHVVALHNEFVDSLAYDLEALRDILTKRLEIEDPGGAHAMWSTFGKIETARVGQGLSFKANKEPKAAEAAEAERAERAHEAERAAEAERAERAERANRAEAGIAGCGECRAYISQGAHGAVYHHKDIKKVVKVFKEEHERLAEPEVRAYGILNQVSESDPSFRSIKARLIKRVKGDKVVRIEIDKLKGLLADYTGADRAEAGRLMKRDGVTYEYFRDLVRQLRILHRHGVAHGDVHDKNIGLIDGGFVLVDPTLLSVSPLSDLYDGHIEQDARPILDALRKATKQGDPKLEPRYRYALDRRIPDLSEDREIAAFLRGFGIKATEASISKARRLVVDHNGVVFDMSDEKYNLNDRNRMKIALRNVEIHGSRGLLDEL